MTDDQASTTSSDLRWPKRQALPFAYSYSALRAQVQYSVRSISNNYPIRICHLYQIPGYQYLQVPVLYTCPQHHTIQVRKKGQKSMHHISYNDLLTLPEGGYSSSLIMHRLQN